MPEETNLETERILRPRPVVLLLIDGWGIAPVSEANAISQAKTPTFFNLIKEYPVALLESKGSSLNVRYLTIGSGQEISDESEKPSGSLTATLSRSGLDQVKISETERFAALTHYFNGQVADRFPDEDWTIVSSQSGKQAAKPLLVLKRTIKALIRTIESDSSDLIIAAIPYLDLMAMTGDYDGVKEAAQQLDKYLRKILVPIESRNGVLIISAACGNAERMKNMATDLPDTGITDNPVPFIIFGRDFKGKTIGLADPLNNDLSLLAPAGNLADIAPTILDIMEIDKPVEMTGHSLLQNNNNPAV